VYLEPKSHRWIWGASWIRGKRGEGGRRERGRRERGRREKRKGTKGTGENTPNEFLVAASPRWVTVPAVLLQLSSKASYKKLTWYTRGHARTCRILMLKVNTSWTSVIRCRNSTPRPTFRYRQITNSPYKNEYSKVSMSAISVSNFKLVYDLHLSKRLVVCCVPCLKWSIMPCRHCFCSSALVYQFF